MFKIDNDTIYLTRGDTAEFRPIVEDYEAQEDDKVVFLLARYPGARPVLKLETKPGESITFSTLDTATLECGSYVYDLRLITADTTSTFVNGARFNLMGDIYDGTND